MTLVCMCCAIARSHALALSSEDVALPTLLAVPVDGTHTFVIELLFLHQQWAPRRPAIWGSQRSHSAPLAAPPTMRWSASCQRKSPTATPTATTSERNADAELTPYQAIWFDSTDEVEVLVSAATATLETVTHSLVGGGMLPLLFGEPHPTRNGSEEPAVVLDVVIGRSNLSECAGIQALTLTWMLRHESAISNINQCDDHQGTVTPTIGTVCAYSMNSAGASGPSSGATTWLRAAWQLSPPILLAIAPSATTLLQSSSTGGAIAAHVGESAPSVTLPQAFMEEASRDEEAAKQTPAAAGHPPFVASQRLLASGLFNPHAPCAGAAGALAACVHARAAVSACHGEQRAYMSCQRRLSGGSAGLNPQPEAMGSGEGGGIGDTPVSDQGLDTTRFATAGIASGQRVGVASRTTSQSIAAAAASSGLSVDEVEGMCAALGEAECVVATTASHSGAGTGVGGIPGGSSIPIGPFGPDLSEVGGLVVGAIIQGIVGPEITELITAFMSKIVTVVPPILRKVLVDGIDPLASLPPMPEIPDLLAIIEQIMAQVEAAKAMALAELARAKAALALIRALAEGALREAAAFRAQMEGVYAALQAQAATQLLAARAAADAALAQARAQTEVLRSQAEIALDAARAATEAVIQQQLAQLTAMVKTATSMGQVSAQEGAGLVKLLGSATTLTDVRNALGLMPNSVASGEVRAAVEADVQRVSHAELAAIATLTAAQQHADETLAAAQASVAKSQRAAASTAVAALTSIGASSLAEALLAAPSGTLHGLSTTTTAPLPSVANMSGLQSMWGDIHSKGAAAIARVGEAKESLKSALKAVRLASEQERAALEESDEVRRALHEQEALAHARSLRLNKHRDGDLKSTTTNSNALHSTQSSTSSASAPPVMHSESASGSAGALASLVELVSDTRARLSDPNGKNEGSPGGRRGGLAVILHDHLSHLLTTAITMGVTANFKNFLVPQLHDLLAPQLLEHLRANLPLRVALTVGPAVEAALSQSVPPLLERALPAYVAHAVTGVTTRLLTESVGHATFESVGVQLVHPVEERECCRACARGGEAQPCACCVSTPAEDAGVRQTVHRKLQHYASYYATQAMAPQSSAKVGKPRPA